MQEVIEFETDIKDCTIKIPNKYSKLDSKHVKISIVETEPFKKIVPEGFSNPIEVSSYSLMSNRDDLYDR